MPIGDLNHEIYKALVELVGEDYVEDEPAVMESFYRDLYSTVTVSVPRLEFLVLPGNLTGMQGMPLSCTVSEETVLA